MLSFQCTCTCSTLLPKLCTKETWDLYHVLYINLMGSLKMHCHIIKFNLSIPGLHVSGFKLEDTDKRTIAEYLTTLNTREVLPASSTASNGIILCSIQILSTEKLIKWMGEVFPFLIFVIQELPSDLVTKGLSFFLRTLICFTDDVRFAWGFGDQTSRLHDFIILSLV